MCGIAGLLDLHGRTPDVDVVRRMTALLHHRGPDAGGLFFEGPCALGHRRLSIVDLAGGAQPMSIDAGALTVTFNGEIFNYVELRAELEKNHGRRFSTRSDTEALLHAYAVWGDACVDHFNGQWAFAIWDRARQRLFCARDRIGVRPLFFAEHGGTFAFASEVKALFAVPGMPRAFDLGGLHEVLTYWCTVAPRTMWRSVRELPPGCTLSVEHGRMEVKRYWQLSYAPATEYDDVITGAIDMRSADESARGLGALLTDAARIRLRADVPVGAYVSGGLDSAVIASIVKRDTDTPLSTFSVGFENAEFDEREYQRDVVDLLGDGAHDRHATIVANEALISAIFPDVVWHAETALLRTSPAPMFALASLVRQSGLKVVLTGEGADEMLGGYDIFKEAKIRRFWARHPTSSIRPRLLRRLYPYMPGIKQQPDAYLRAFFHVRPQDVDHPFFSHLPRWRLTQQLTSLLSRDAAAALADHDPLTELRDRLPREYATWSAFAQAQYLESTILLPGYILSSQGDRVAMAHSIEGRFPFLDARVMEYAGRLPVPHKMRALDEKHVLKRFATAARLVPDRVLQRPKQPYRAPDASCFFDAERGTSRHEWIDAALSDSAVRDAGVFDPEAVRRLVDKARRGAATSTKDGMGLVAILSTQLLHERFIRKFAEVLP